MLSLLPAFGQPLENSADAIRSGLAGEALGGQVIQYRHPRVTGHYLCDALNLGHHGNHSNGHRAAPFLSMHKWKCEEDGARGQNTDDACDRDIAFGFPISQEPADLLRRRHVVSEDLPILVIDPQVREPRHG